MTSTTTKKICAKCDKGAGTAMCYGCEQSFCTKHFIEHRQELSQQIDNIGQEHDVLRKDLTDESSIHHFIERINQWEQESITKIRTAAQSARTDLQKFLNEAKNNLKTSVSKMTEELQSSRESDDYTEVDIKKWTDRLQEFRQMLNSPTTVKINYENDDGSAIRLIKVSDQQLSDSSYQVSQLRQSHNRVSHSLESSVEEKFVETFGNIELSKDGLVATCLCGNNSWSCASGIGRYSSGIYCIRIQIEQKGIFFPFFGIVSCSEKMTDDILHSKSCHGWWNSAYSVVSGKAGINNSSTPIQEGDTVNLVLDCDGRRIQFEHIRTKRFAEMPIDLGLCAFPWKIIVLLHDTYECVRILH